MRKIAFGVLAAGILLLPMAVEALDVGGSVRAWESTLKADLEVDTTAIDGTDLDLENDLDLDDRETVTEYRAWLGFGNSRLTGSYVLFENEGQKTLTQSIVFDGTTYAVNTTVTSDINIEMADVTFDSPLPFLSFGSLGSVNWLAGVKFLGFEGELAAAGQRTSESFDVPIPQIGAAARVNFLMMDAFASAKGLAFDAGGGQKGQIIDAEAGVGATWKLARIEGGYRLFDIDVSSDDADLEFQYGGPFAGIGLSI